MTKKEKTILTKFYEREMNIYKFYRSIEKVIPIEVSERTALVTEIYMELLYKPNSGLIRKAPISIIEDITK